MLRILLLLALSTPLTLSAPHKWLHRHYYQPVVYTKTIDVQTQPEHNVYVEKPVEKPYVVEVPKPYPVYVDKPYTVYVDKPTPVYVEKPKPVYVEKPKPVYVEKPTPVYVEKPKPVYVERPAPPPQKPVVVHQEVVHPPPQQNYHVAVQNPITFTVKKTVPVSYDVSSAHAVSYESQHTPHGDSSSVTHHGSGAPVGLGLGFSKSFSIGIGRK